MFDFFKEMGQEMVGIDSNAAKKEKLEKKKEQAKRDKENCYLLTKKAKSFIVTMGVLYLVLSVNTIVALKNMNGSALDMTKYIIMSIIVIGIIISLITGKNKGEIVAIIGMFLFASGLIISIALL